VIVGTKTFPIVFRAQHNKGYTSSLIEHELGRVVDYIDKHFPTLEFRQVELAPNKFNFIACGARKAVTNVPTTSSEASGEEGPGPGTEI